ncbi:hypothetical protein BRARA_D00682 [Brassica rapa]|uniref:Uncharacterized protein n=1 Tax=Brassica campestris TaxID=3711 RepID=A0A397ZIL9_BRACM|nr:hypothetical protein BRARA_D00682 [Brassica rapa]
MDPWDERSLGKAFADFLYFCLTRQTKECFLQQPCENSPACDEFCKSKGYIQGGYCQHYLGPKHNNCCCYLVDSEKFFKFDDTNVLITN